MTGEISARPASADVMISPVASPEEGIVSADFDPDWPDGGEGSK
jgi:hypothetical protein